MVVFYKRALDQFARDFRVSLHTPFHDLPEEAVRILLFGTSRKQAESFGASFVGVVPNLEQRFKRTESQYVKQRLHVYMGELPCPACDGARLRPEVRAVKVAEKAIHEVCRMTVEEADSFFSGLRFSGEKGVIARPILKEIRSRLGFLVDVGLGYLTLDRSSSSLAGGEAQRIRLGTQVGSALVGVCYVLDEPTIGLHQRDALRLVATLERLRDLGNTVIVVEHDEETIRHADHLIDLGPGAGAEGGRIVAQGRPEKFMEQTHSLTVRYLLREEQISVPFGRRRPPKHEYIELRGGRENNLKNLTVRFPLRVLCCVTGVSGSGKSTLVDQVLYRALARRLYRARAKPGAYEQLVGAENVDKVVVIDQSPIGRTPRSNPATYTGVFDQIRALYARTSDARIRGYTAGRFSFNVKGGRCEACQGQGTKKIEMHFLPDIFVTCEECKGSRYNRETLEVRYRGRNVAETLEMTVAEALAFFANFPKAKSFLETLSDVGLGYLRLGQPSTTLSGGEAQRVKLATELGKRSTGNTLYILDEPTTGLHYADVRKLLDVLNRLVDLGNTVLVIEHNLEVVKCADYIIDLGPEGGEGGGHVVVQGTPEEIAQAATSHTGRFLAEALARGRRALLQRRGRASKLAVASS
jgi:excinuclease ABC subunit A